MRGGAALAAAAGLAAAACQAAPHAVPRAAASGTIAPARITITSGNLRFSSAGHAAPGPAGAVVTRAATAPLTDRRPDRGIHITVSGGRLSSVSVTAGAGRRVPGAMQAEGRAWNTVWALATAQTYHVTAIAYGRQGRRAVAVGTFRTLRPRRTFTAYSTLAQGQVYGVGMPIMVTFTSPIKDRAEVERALAVRSSKPVTGAWYWLSGTQVWFRPQHYWPAHTRVRLTAHLRGVRGAPGMYGSGNLALHFRIGGSLVAVASAASHHMRVWWNGHLEGNWPVSTGQPGDDTPDGRYLSFDMGNPVDMDSATYGVMPGDPGYYNVLVYYSVKFTDSGDYVHSAPWSVGEQGLANVSHGCVNVAPGEAAWYYGHSLLGDPITIVGSPLRGTWGDGWTIWFLSWRKLVAGSGTGLAVQAGRDGSRLVTPRYPVPSQPHRHTRVY
jgi:lipoprotein-anchoring transpeptidase ErfK/SrfK